MIPRLLSRLATLPLVVTVAIVTAAMGFGQATQSKKIYLVTDMEGVDGIFDIELQCDPQRSPRWEESRRLLTGEVNAAVKGLYEGGATEVFVYDGHDSGRSLSVLDIDPRVHVLLGRPISPSAELDASYSALAFVGQHAMAGAEKGVLTHTESWDAIQNIWVNARPTGEIGFFVMMAGHFGIPAIMLSGDAAACREFHELVPEGECAEVKTGVSRTAAWMLSHSAACALITETARSAMQRLPQIKSYNLTGPVEVKVEYTPQGTPLIPPREGIEQLNDRTWVFRGTDIIDVCSKYFPLLGCN
jgi:D-amino peptidase